MENAVVCSLLYSLHVLGSGYSTTSGPVAKKIAKSYFKLPYQLTRRQWRFGDRFARALVYHMGYKMYRIFKRFHGWKLFWPSDIQADGF